MTGPEFASINYLQAKNQLNTFAEMTGGYAWFPRFEGEMNDIFNSRGGFLAQPIHDWIYAFDGAGWESHKLKVEVWITTGNPLMTLDKKGHKKKIVVNAREGYTSPKPTTGD